VSDRGQGFAHLARGRAVERVLLALHRPAGAHVRPRTNALRHKPPHPDRLSGELQHAREQLVLTREEERRRLRRDLHDDLAPSLAALGLTAATARDLLTPELTPESVAAAQLLKEVHVGLRNAVGDIRRIAYELRPPILDELGLVAAIRERAARLDGRDRPNGSPIRSRLQIVVEAPDPLPPLPATVEVATYRIVQEALMNVIRHAEAANCVVRLSLNGGLHVEVLDDGVGQPASVRPGIGLRSMRERAVELGGSCTIEQRMTAGTRVHASLPLNDERE
jgi:two-component system, NarL family, sensor kinase